MVKIELLSHMPFGSSIFRYGYDIKRSVRLDVSFKYFNFRPSENDRFSKDASLDITTISGRKLAETIIELPINYTFRSIVFRNTIKELKQTVRDGGIVHYLDHLFPPLKEIDPEASVVTLHDAVNKKLNFDSPIYEKQAKRYLNFYRKFDHVLANSNYVKNELMNLGFNGKVEVIYYPSSPEFTPIPDKIELRKKLGLPLDKKLILSVSTSVRRKNLGTVLATLNTLGSDYKLVRIGSPLGNAITFAGVSYESIAEVYNACDVLLFPSLEEGFGLPIIEAFACGLPVVASNIEVFREIANNAAVLVEPTTKECVVGIKEALSGKDTYSKAGMDRSKLFSMVLFGRKMQVYYENMIKK